MTLGSNKSVEIAPEKNNTLSEYFGSMGIHALIDALGLVSYFNTKLVDPRNPDRTTYTLPQLVIMFLLKMAAGLPKQSDSDKHRNDPILRVATSTARGVTPIQDEHTLASQPTMSRALHILSMEKNQQVLRKAHLDIVTQHMQRQGGGECYENLTIDVDGTDIPTHGHQPGSAWNGYLRDRIYHPLVALEAETGHILGAQLRKGNASAAEDALPFIEHIADHCTGTLCKKLTIRMDAGFNGPALYTGLEKRGIHYVMRLRKNARLIEKQAEAERNKAIALAEGQEEGAFDMSYQAYSWDINRRVVLVVKRRPGELFTKTFWLITNIPESDLSAEELVALYRRRGKAEHHIGEWKQSTLGPLSSTPRSNTQYKGGPVQHPAPVRAVDPTAVWPPNQTLLLLYMLAYGLLHISRTLMTGCTEQETFHTLFDFESTDSINPELTADTKQETFHTLFDFESADSTNPELTVDTEQENAPYPARF